jgi:hypothetical protein
MHNLLSGRSLLAGISALRVLTAAGAYRAGRYLSLIS